MDEAYSSEEEDLALAQAESFSITGYAGHPLLSSTDQSDASGDFVAYGGSSGGGGSRNNSSDYAGGGSGAGAGRDDFPSAHSIRSLCSAFSCQDLLNAVLDYEAEEAEAQGLGLGLGSARASPQQNGSCSSSPGFLLPLRPPPRDPPALTLPFPLQQPLQQPFAAAAAAAAHDKDLSSHSDAGFTTNASVDSPSPPHPALGLGLGLHVGALRLVAAEEDGEIMDGLPEVAMGTDIASLGVNTFVVLDARGEELLQSLPPSMSSSPSRDLRRVPVLQAARGGLGAARSLAYNDDDDDVEEEEEEGEGEAADLSLSLDEGGGEEVGPGRGSGDHQASSRHACSSLPRTDDAEEEEEGGGLCLEEEEEEGEGAKRWYRPPDMPRSGSGSITISCRRPGEESWSLFRRVSLGDAPGPGPGPGPGLGGHAAGAGAGQGRTSPAVVDTQAALLPLSHAPAAHTSSPAPSLSLPLSLPLPLPPTHGQGQGSGITHALGLRQGHEQHQHQHQQGQQGQQGPEHSRAKTISMGEDELMSLIRQAEAEAGADPRRSPPARRPNKKVPHTPPLSLLVAGEGVPVSSDSDSDDSGSDDSDSGEEGDLEHVHIFRHVLSLDSSSSSRR